MRAAGVLLATVSAGNARAGTQAVFCVDPIHGNDDNRGSSMAQAFRSIETARNAVRSINGSMTGDIYVFLAGGTYQQRTTLTFNQYDSGSNGYSVIYKNHNSVPPVISGGQQITGWTLHQDGIYRATGVNFDFRQLWVDGVRATRARRTRSEITRDYPLTQLSGAQGYRTRDMAWLNYGNPSQIEFVYDRNQTGQIQWVNRRALVSTVESQGNECTIRMRDLYQAQTLGWPPWLAVGLPVWVENAYEFLDQPGEWYLNRTTHELFYLPLPGQNMSSATVIAPKIETIVEVKPDVLLQQRVAHIKFEGITFAFGNGWMGIDRAGGINDVQADMVSAGGVPPALPGNVRVESVKGITFESCVFTHLGGEGLDIAYSQDTTVNRCTFSDITGNGLQVLGHVDDPAMLDSRKITRNTLIRNSDVTHCGVERWGAVGILLGYTQGTTVVSNEVRNLPYSGISSGWGWGAADSPYSKGNSISYNYVHDVMGRLRDGGLVYTLGSQRGSTLVGNYLDNETSGAGTLKGIYFDNGTAGFSAYHNVVKNINRVDQHWLVVNAAHDIVVDGSYIYPGQFSCVYDGTCVTPPPGTLRLTDTHEEFPWSKSAMSVINNAGLRNGGVALNPAFDQAQNKGASASSWWNPDYAPARANDGDVYRGWASGPGDVQPYWDVDLGAPYLLSKVELVARQDVDEPSCRRNFDVLAANSSDFGRNAVVVRSQGAIPFPHQGTWPASLPGVTAYRYLRVRKNVDNEGLFIAEFRARGLPLPPSNIAARKAATASSHWGEGYEAGKAVDGATSTAWVSGYYDSLPHWQVDLKGSFQINRIELVARQDSDQPSHRRNFEVRASTEANFADYSVLGGQPSASFSHRGTWALNVSDGEPYRYLQVRKTVGGERMYIGEFRVYANPAFAPPQRSGLKLWLEADAGVTKDGQNLITVWADQSGNHNDAAQSIQDSRPVWMRYAINRMPAVRFDGSNDFLSVPSLTGTMNAFTVFVVIKPFSLTNWNQVLGAAGGWGQFRFHSSTDGTIHAGTSVSSRLVTGAQVCTDNTVQRYSYTFDSSGAASLRKNGAELASGTLSPPAPWTGFALGTNASNTLHGDVAELLVYDIALSDADRQLVEDYLRDKYGY